MSSTTWWELKDLTSIVQRAVPHRTQVLNRTASQSHEYVQLFKTLTRPEVSEETDAAMLLGKSVADPSYKMARTFLKKILLNTLFVLDFEGTTFSSFTAAQHRSNRDVFLIKTLASLGARRTARNMAIPMLKLATKYEFLSNKLELLGFLRADAALLGNHKDQKRFHREFNATLLAYQAENNAYAYLEEIQSAFASSASEKPQLQELVGRYAKEVQKASSNYPTFILQLSALRLEAIYYQIGLDFERALVVAMDAQTFVESHRLFKSPGRIAEFALKRMVCLLNLQRYDEGIDLAKTSLRLIESDTINWIAIMEYRFLLEMHALKFAEARTSFERVRNSSAFSKLPPPQIQKWNLYELYLDFAQKISRSSLKHPIDFLQSIPAYNKDKAGYHFAALVLQIVSLIGERDFLKVTGRIASLVAYNQRYLKRNGAEPERNFLKLIFLLERASFDYKQIVGKSNLILNALKANSSSSAAGPQILPYEYLWDRIVESLERR